MLQIETRATAQLPRSSQRERQDAYETVTADITDALERGSVHRRTSWRRHGAALTLDTPAADHAAGDLMPRYRHVIYTRGDDLPGHLARTLCGRVVAYARQPNVSHGDPRFCARCHALDRPTASAALIHTVAQRP